MGREGAGVVGRGGATTDRAGSGAASSLGRARRFRRVPAGLGALNGSRRENRSDPAANTPKGPNWPQREGWHGPGATKCDDIPTDRPALANAAHPLPHLNRTMANRAASPLSALAERSSKTVVA